MKRNEDVINFLLYNGFSIIESDHYYNDKCQVIISDYGYEIKIDEGSMFSHDFNIYWLIGVLTWYNYINKNYKTF